MGTKDDPKRDFVNKFFNNNMRQNTLAATLTDSSKKNMTPTKNTGELNQVKQMTICLRDCKKRPSKSERLIPFMPMKNQKMKLRKNMKMTSKLKIRGIQC